jgi:hypothetical protein
MHGLLGENPTVTHLPNFGVHQLLMNECKASPTAGSVNLKSVPPKVPRKQDVNSLQQYNDKLFKYNSRSANLIESVKCYPSQFHVFRERHHSDYTINETGRIARSRYVNMVLANENLHLHNQYYRIEVSGELGPHGNDDIYKFKQALRVFFEVWKLLKITYIPVKMVQTVNEWIYNWAISDSVPSDMRAFNIRHCTSITPARRFLIALVNGNTGIVSDKSCNLWRLSFDEEDGGKDGCRPYEWLFHELIRFVGVTYKRAHPQGEMDWPYYLKRTHRTFCKFLLRLCRSYEKIPNINLVADIEAHRCRQLVESLF